MESKPYEIAALGRALYPGMLYDCRKDTFIPGVTLWSKECLKSDIIEHLLPKTDLKFSTSDSLSEKANLLDVTASLKASFLAGLVEVEGSAEYLRDTKSSMNQSRCSMLYSVTTKLEQLTMTQLGNIKNRKQKTATHVVTAALYGAQAFMVFDHMASGAEEQQKVEGNIHAVVKKIPCLDIEGKGKVVLNENEKKLADEISVTLYSDFHLDQNPTTYQEAIDLYKKLPTLLKNKEYFGVPVKVWLYPLVLLDKKAATLVREISTRQVSKTEHLLEHLAEIERKCNDLTRSRTAQDFPDLKVRLQSFHDCQSDYKTVFQKALCRVLPAIRGGKQEDQALAEVIEIHNKSPFAADQSNKWLENITTESRILSSYTKKLEGIRVVTSSGDLNSILFDPDVDTVVCLAFTSLANPDKFIHTLNEFLKSAEFNKLEDVRPPLKSSSTEQEPWFTNFDISQSMRENLYLFKSFSEANQDNKGFQFVIASVPDPSNPGTSIRLYEKGQLTNPKFKPVSKPPPPTVKLDVLKRQKSPTGETVRFRIEYKQGQSQEEKKVWEVSNTPDAPESYTLTGLQTNKVYEVKYRAVSDVGVSEASESIDYPPNTPENQSTDDDPKDCAKDCAVVGGFGGVERLLFANDIGKSLKKIEVWVRTYGVIAMCVYVTPHQRFTFGHPSYESCEEFEFEDGDRFTSLTLWPNCPHTRLGGMEFEILRGKKSRVKFSAKCSYLGDPVRVNVRSGICWGVKVRSGDEVDSFGFIFKN